MQKICFLRTYSSYDLSFLRTPQVCSRAAETCQRAARSGTVRVLPQMVFAAKVVRQTTDVEQTHAEWPDTLSSNFCSPSHVEDSLTVQTAAKRKEGRKEGRKEVHVVTTIRGHPRMHTTLGNSRDVCVYSTIAEPTTLAGGGGGQGCVVQLTCRT